jgi:hypothetical protein
MFDDNYKFTCVDRFLKYVNMIHSLQRSQPVSQVLKNRKFFLKNW